MVKTQLNSTKLSFEVEILDSTSPGDGMAPNIISILEAD
jgi:hypothetical protein